MNSIEIISIPLKHSNKHIFPSLACEKEEFESFYKEVADILVKRDRESRVMLNFQEFKKGRIT